MYRYKLEKKQILFAINEHKKGVGLKTLADFLGVHHTSLIYRFKKADYVWKRRKNGKPTAKLIIEEPPVIPLIEEPPPTDPEVEKILNEKICQGKKYLEYLCGN